MISPRITLFNCLKALSNSKHSNRTKMNRTNPEETKNLYTEVPQVLITSGEYTDQQLSSPLPGLSYVNGDRTWTQSREDFKHSQYKLWFAQSTSQMNKSYGFSSTGASEASTPIQSLKPSPEPSPNPSPNPSPKPSSKSSPAQSPDRSREASRAASCTVSHAAEEEHRREVGSKATTGQGEGRMVQPRA